MRSSCGFLGEGGAQVRRGRGAKRGELRGAALAGQGRAAPRQPRKVGPPTSVGQQPGPIARFADVGRLSLWRHRDQDLNVSFQGVQETSTEIFTFRFKESRRQVIPRDCR